VSAKDDKPEVAPAPDRSVNINKAGIDDLCAVFRVSKVTIHTWAGKGCPRNEDGTFVIYDVYKWLTRKDKKGGLTEQKIEAEIERIKAQTEKISEKYVLREEHERLMNSWATSFKKPLPA